jgi:hypothetical protein
MNIVLPQTASEHHAPQQRDWFGDSRRFNEEVIFRPFIFKSHRTPRFQSSKRATLISTNSALMTSAIKGFHHEPKAVNLTPQHLISMAICSMIAPCLIGIGISQKLNQWPLNTAVFKIW